MVLLTGIYSRVIMLTSLFSMCLWSAYMFWILNLHVPVPQASAYDIASVYRLILNIVLCYIIICSKHLWMSWWSFRIFFFCPPGKIIFTSIITINLTHKTVAFIRWKHYMFIFFKCNFYSWCCFREKETDDFAYLHNFKHPNTSYQYIVK